MAAIYRFLLWCAVIVAGLYGILRATAIRVWQIPLSDANLGASLAPNLAAGDWVVLWRLTPPGLGSLVVCADPDDPRESILGRIAARAGDLVSVEKGVTSVNSQPLVAAEVCLKRKLTLTDPASARTVEVGCDIEQLGSVVHERAFALSTATTRKFETQVGADRVFLLSDNRAFPLDSRHFGTVLNSSCRETIVFRIFSARGFFDFEKRLTFIR